MLGHCIVKRLAPASRRRRRRRMIWTYGHMVIWTVTPHTHKLWTLKQAAQV